MLLKFLYSVKSFASGSIHICKYFSLLGPNKDFWRDQLNTHLKHIHKQILTIILYQRKMINTFGLLMPCYLQERRLGPFHLKISSTNCAWQRCPSCSYTGCKQVTITGKYREKVKIPTHWTDHGAKITSKKKMQLWNRLNCHRVLFIYCESGNQHMHLKCYCYWKVQHCLSGNMR